MQNNGNENRGKAPLMRRLLGEPTQAKASGLAFSASPVLSSVLFSLVIVLLSLFGLTQDDSYKTLDWYYYLRYIFPQLCFALLAAWYLSYIGKSPKTALREQKCHPKYFFWALLLQIGLFSLSELNSLFLLFLEKFGYQAPETILPNVEGFGFVGVWLVVALLPAVFEEIFFRGVLLKGLKSFGFTGSVLLCGALFALHHQNPPQTIYQFCCGTAFALVTLRSGSVLPTVLSHLFNNTLILVLYACGIETFPLPVFVVYVCVSAICLVVSLVYFLFLDKNRQGKMTESKSLQAEKTAERKRFFLFAAVGILLCLITWIAGLFPTGA